MRVAIHQPNYAPWCGYFTKLASCDLFIFLDDVQMPSGRSYVSRCQVLAPPGRDGEDAAAWLSVPVHHGPEEPIATVRIADGRFGKKHLGTLRANYARSPFFAEVFPLLAPLYEGPGEGLCAFNLRLIAAVSGYLGLAVPTRRASELPSRGAGDERLLSLIAAVGGTCYLSGPGGQNYQDPARFAAAGVQLEVRRYQPLPYPQRRAAFVPGLSILDALFHLGPGARELLRYDR